MRKHSIRPTTSRRSQAGTSLIEVTIAMAVLLIASVGILGLCAVSMIATENQGHLMARASEYAQDKAEQLLSLAYTDSASDTATFPTSDTGGTGLTVGGSSNPSAPATGYVDYLDNNVTPLAIVGGVAPANWYYIRVWAVSNPAGAPVFGGLTTLKQITITAKIRQGVAGARGGGGAAPQATMSSLITYSKP